MTPEQQRIALCGWFNGFDMNAQKQRFMTNDEAWILRDQPDTDSLDALHEMEKRLNVNQLSEYADALDKICVPTHICPLTHWQAVVMATAAQRSEALLRTLGMWKEDE